MNARERVWKQMVQMFGPQWIDKWGATNEAWDAALKDLTYAQVSAGLKAVLSGKLRYYEVDLPNFIQLCRPVVPIEHRRVEKEEKFGWQEGMKPEEINFNLWANKYMMAWAMARKEDIPPDRSMRVWLSCRRICKDFWAMRQELGEGKVSNLDVVEALTKQWERDLR